MPTVSRGAVAASVLLSTLILLIWLLQTASLADLGHSDAAGNAMAQGFTAIEIIVLWVLLAVLLAVCGVAGRMPWPAAAAAVILLPASGYAAIIALDLLANNDTPPYLWPIVTPTLVPPIVVGFCFWTLLPVLRSMIPTALAAGVAWGATLLLCVALWPMVKSREAAIEQQEALRAKWDADFASLSPGASLWDLTPFLDTRDDTRQTAALERIRKLDRRQAETEVMLDRGDFPLLYLGRIDLDPTPSLCDKARADLRRQVKSLMPQAAGSRPYAEVADRVAAALAAMKWLVGNGCSCDAESLAWESMARAYRDTNFDVYELAELRDPGALGRVLLQSPDRFSMLTPRAHLRAWLRFAREEATHDRALAGARTLDHRTDDAIEMLGHDEFEAGAVLAYMPALDLAATEPLCAASLKVLHERVSQIYRPRPDDPRSYDELLSRLGADQPLTALQWLASHGCRADAVLGEAADLVRTYQDSPARTSMLAGLEQLHRGP